MLTKEEKVNLLYLIEDKPIEAIEKLFACSLWDKQREIVNSVLLEHNRKTAVRSCHDSGKSFVAGRLALAYLIANPNSLVITTAPSWTQVREILWREIRACYGNLESSGMFTVGAKMLGGTKIEIGANWFAIGIATRKEGDSTDVADRMLGFHSPSGKILIIVDEGSGIQEPIWGAIDGLLTSTYAQLVAFGNPYRKTGTFAKMFSSQGVKKIHIQDTDIPNIKEGKVIVAGLMSPNYPKEMAEKYGVDSNLYRIKVKGEFPLSESDTLIPLSDIEDAFSRDDVPPEGEKKMGVDVARFGDDRTVFVVRQGRKVLLKECYKKEDTMETVGRIVEKIITEGIKPENTSVDDIGVGGGVVDRLKEKGYEVNGVNVGMKAEVEEEEFAIDKDKIKERRFINTRASSYWAVKDWIKTASIPRDDDFLELSNIKYKFSSSGIKIEPKEDIKKRGLGSPDVADALMLTFCPNLNEGYGHLEFL